MITYLELNATLRKVTFNFRHWVSMLMRWLIQSLATGKPSAFLMRYVYVNFKVSGNTVMFNCVCESLRKLVELNMGCVKSECGDSTRMGLGRMTMCNIAKHMEKEAPESRHKRDNEGVPKQVTLIGCR